MTAVQEAFAAASQEVATAENTDGTSVEQVEATNPEAVAVETPAATTEPATEVVTFKVKVDGQEVEVTQEELLAGYSRQEDYTRKTQALARERQELAQLTQFVEQLRSDPQSTISALAEAYGIEFGATAEPEYLTPEEERLAKVESFIQQQEEAQLQRQIDATLADIRD